MRTNVFLFCCLLIYSCSPVSKHILTNRFKVTENKFHDHTGFILFDPETHKELYSYNADAYFTPASNAKILTFFTCLNVLRDSIPGIRFITSGDSLIFWGTGDPSFLYKNTFTNARLYDFLVSTNKKLYFSASNFCTTNLGSGWAWDDYNDYYSAERFSFPIYGNIVSISGKQNSIGVAPKFFKKNVVKTSLNQATPVKRAVDSNAIFYSPDLFIKKKIWEVPFRTSADLVVQLIADTLKKPVLLTSRHMPTNASTFYTVPVDSLYKVMMQQSDNFIAEQLLLACSSIISDTLKPEIGIRYASQNLFANLTNKPVWVDGSGLSRYNLVTPCSIVEIWDQIYHRVPVDRLFSLLAIGGKPGTLQNWYKSDTPYLFGKTGTLSNNHSLSGYLISKKGKTLIFSFMSNNYTCTTNEIRKNMESILITIRNHY